MKHKGFTPLEIERKRKRSRFLTGFTLIELLVVVVVIGILAGMSFVMIQGVIDMTRRARSKSFSKSIQLQLALNDVGVWRFDDNPLIPVISGVHDDSGWGNHGTLRNTSLLAAWVPGVFGRALRFDGRDDFVNVPNSASFNITEAITIEGWLFWDGGDRWRWNNVFIKRLPPEHFGLFLNRAGRFARYCSVIGGTRRCLDSLSNSIPINQWLHIALTYDGANQRIFINGAQAAIFPRTGLMTTNTAPFRIGGYIEVGNVDHFSGRIDEPRIYNRALTVFEIQQRYVKGLKSLLARGIITDEEFNARIAEKEKNLAINKE